MSPFPTMVLAKAMQHVQVQAAAPTMGDFVEATSLLGLVMRGDTLSEVEIGADGSLTTAAGVVSAEDVAFIENLAKTAVESNSKIDDTSKAAVKAIDETLESSLEMISKSHNADRDLLIQVAERADICDSNFNSAIEKNWDLQDKAEVLEDDHASCRAKLAGEDADAKAKCEDSANFLKGMKAPTFTSSEGDLAAFWAKQKAFFQSTTNLDTSKAKLKDCKTATELAKNTDAECDSKQHALETAMCPMQLTVLTSCSEYTSCYDIAKRDFDSAANSLTVQLKQRKLLFEGVKRIQCFIKIILSGESRTKDDIKACQDMTPDIKELILNEPVLPEFRECDLSSVQSVPCDAGYMNKYEDMVGLKDCQACPQLPGHLQSLIAV